MNNKSIILNEGGNVEIGGVAAQRLDLNKIPRTQAVKAIDKALQAINIAFNKMYKVPLWSPELIKNKEFLSGSAFHFFNVSIPDEQFVKVKPSVGDIDTMVDKKLVNQAKDFLTQATGKKIGNAKLVGFKPNPGQDTLITLWEFAEPPMKVQVDMELVDYAKGSPSEWSKFSHSSAWEDLSVGVKGVFHKYLLRSLTHKDAKDRYIQMKTKLKKVTAADLAFAVTGGVRQKFEPVIDPKTKKPAVAPDGLGIYKEIPAGESQYVNKTKDMFTLLMGRKPAKGEEQKLASFVGVLDLINNNFSPDEKMKIATAFQTLLFGPAAQQLYKGDPASDKKEKEIALNKLIQTLAINFDKAQLAKTIADYYSNYQAESLTEADGPDYTRQGIKHIYNPGSTVEMKDADFLAFVDAIAKNGGTLDNIPITLKVDGAGIRFGRDQAGKPFFMTSRVTTPMYAKQIGAFAKYSQDNNGTPEQVARAAKYDQALDLIVNSDFIKTLPKDTIVQAEMLFMPMAEKTEQGLKFVNISYDKKKLGKQMTLVPITARKYSDGAALPNAESILQKLETQSNNDIKIVGTDLQHSDIDVSNIVEPIVKMDSQLRAALTSKKKNDPNKEKAKAILSQARKAISDAIINSPNIKGQDKLGDTNEGLVIAMPNGQLAKVTSTTMKDAMAAKKAAPRTGGNRTKAAVVTAGSFVGHVGHQAVVDAVIKAAKKLGGDPYVYISAKVGPDDPIPPEVKLQTWKKLYPEYASMFQLITSPDGTVPNPMKKIEKELVLPQNSPYKKIVLMVGTDRYEGFKKWMDTLEKRMKDPAALAKYGGTQDQVSFDTIAIPRGAALGGIDASFTALRNVLKDPKLSLKQKLEAWMKGFGNKLDADWVKKLMMLSAQGMGFKLNEVQVTEKIQTKKDKYETNITFPDGRVFISGHLLERIALRDLSQKDMLDMMYKAKEKFGQQIANLPNVDFVIKRKDGLGFGIAKILMPDDSFKYVIKTAHDKKNVGKFQTSYVVEDDEEDLNVKFHDELNPAIWTKDKKMSPAVRKKLMDIAEDFKSSLGITKFSLKDITVSGSNAAYNYTPLSDIDLHLVVDLPQADHDNIYRELFDAKKFQYNEQHDYQIKNYDVELYVQNANDEHISQGIYSILRDEWIKEPQPVEATYDEVSTRSKYDTLKHLVFKAIKAKDYFLADKLRRTIKKYRQVGLQSTGEFGPENLAFKALRANGYIKQLYTLLNDLKDKEFSLESHEQRLTEIDMSPGSLVKFSSTPAAQNTMVGFEAEMIVPYMKSSEAGEDEPDMDYDDYVDASTTSAMRRDLINFFSETTTEREIDRAVSEVDEEIMEYIDEQFRDYLRDNRAEVIEKYKQETTLSDDEIEHSIDEEDSTYDELVEQLRDDFMNNWYDLSGALGSLDLERYSGWDNRFGFGWPHYSMAEHDEFDDDAFKEAANSIEAAVQMPIKASPNYHAFSTREEGTWYLETDSSIDAEGDEGGLELISPPMPLPQAMEKLAVVFDWMDKHDAMTNASTGFHMGVSIPNMENVDYLKLVLFLGDKYVLEQFGRITNTYTRSALGKMEQINGPDLMRRMPGVFDALKGGLDKAAMKLIESALVPRGDKYVSINIKNKYIEFRSAGGNYIEQFEKIKNTMLRYVRVMNLAADPNEAKEEYAKKLFKLLAGSVDKSAEADTIKWFTMFSVGEMSKEELVNRLKHVKMVRTAKKNPQAQLVEPMGRWSRWDVYSPDNEVVHSVSARDRDEAIRLARTWANANNQTVSRVQLDEPIESKEIVTELANQPYPFRFTPAGEGDVNAVFSTNTGIKYEVTMFEEGEDEASIEFSAKQPKKKSTVAITNTGDAFKVFATVAGIIKQFLTMNPEITKFNFSADEGEKSRIKLYNSIAKMLPKFLPDWQLLSSNEKYGFIEYYFGKVSNESRPTSLAGYIEESAKPFVWKKEEPKQELTEMQKACILGGHEYTGEI